MSIKPIDFQMSIPKTSEISKIQNLDNQRDHINHDQASFAMQKQTQHDMKSVNSTDKALEGKIKEKQEQNGHKNKKQSSQKEQKESSQDNTKGNPNLKGQKGNIIDIHI